MSINLYSKDSVDSLLSAKLSDAPVDGNTYGRKDAAWEIITGGGGLTISTLSNGATSTLNSTAPTTGQALTFDGTDLVWATVGGGSYLPLAGGAMDTDAVITIANASSDIRYGSDYIGLNLTASAGATGATFDYAGISIFDGSNNINLQATQYLVQDATNSTTITPANVALNDGTSSLSVSSTGITFPDSTTQTTAGGPAYTADKCRADGIAMLIGYFPYYNSYLNFNYVSSPPIFIPVAGSSWGIYDSGSSTFCPLSYISGATAYFSGNWFGGPFYVRFNGTDSSFTF